MFHLVIYDKIDFYNILYSFWLVIWKKLFVQYFISFCLINNSYF